MNTSRLLLPTLILACLPALAACSRSPDPQTPAETVSESGPAAQSTGIINEKIQKALREASESLATKNMPVGGQQTYRNGMIHIGRNDSNLPKAEITPQGDLLINEKAVAIDEAQRQLLLDHRANLVAITQAGIAVGMQGAELGMQGASLGMKAASGALKSVFSGNSEEFEKQMEAEGKRIEAEGKRIEAEANRMICGHMPALLASQNALAAALPEFKPYATMETSDVKDCGKEDGADVDVAEAAPETTETTSEDGVDTAAEADAAASRKAPAR